VTLRDGRALCFSTWEVRQPKGANINSSSDTPPVIVLYLHGFPGTKLECEIVCEAALEQGIAAGEVRDGRGAVIVALDRPGFGDSSSRQGWAPRWTLLDVASDCMQLIDHLSCDAFAVVGVSGGGPYALAVAAHCQATGDKRCRGVTLVASVCCAGSLDGMMAANQMMSRLIRFSPWLAPWLLWLNFSVMRVLAIWFPGLLEKQMTGSRMNNVLPEVDVAVMKEKWPRLLRGLQGALRHGAWCAAMEASLLFSCKWGFQLGNIEMPVAVFHGESDSNVPICQGRYLAKMLPNSKLEEFKGLGHVSLVVTKAAAYVATALRQAAGSSMADPVQ